MRVAYITSQATSTAGWGRYTVELIKGIQAHGVQPVLVIPDGVAVAPALQHLETHRILPPVLSQRLSTPRSLFYARRLRGVLKSCDVAHCTVELYAPLVALARRGLLPFILNAHGTWAIRPLENAAQRLFFAPAFRAAGQVLCLTPYTQKRLANLIQLDNTSVVTGGVWVADYQQAVDVDLPDWTHHANIALTAAAIKPRKGQHITAQAIAQARQQIPNLHYVMVGPADEKSGYVQDLWRMVEALGAADFIHYQGIVPQDELVKWYQRADVFVLNALNDGSSFEGLGMVYLEAGAAGTPSIGSYDCGAEAAIVNGKSGLLVPQGDVAATAQAFIDMLSDKPRLQAMAQAATAHAHQLSWQNLSQQVFEIYQRLA